MEKVAKIGGSAEYIRAPPPNYMSGQTELIVRALMIGGHNSGPSRAFPQLVLATILDSWAPKLWKYQAQCRFLWDSNWVSPRALLILENLQRYDSRPSYDKDYLVT